MFYNQRLEYIVLAILLAFIGSFIAEAARAEEPVFLNGIDANYWLYLPAIHQAKSDGAPCAFLTLMEKFCQQSGVFWMEYREAIVMSRIGWLRSAKS